MLEQPVHGFFYWNELMTRDPQKAKAFYARTLGWEYQEWAMSDGEYYVVMLNDKPVGGIFNMSGPEFDGMPEHWFSYISVDDVDQRVAQAEEAGGRLMRPLFDVPKVGRIAILSDPGGAVVGWITPNMEE